MKVLNYQDVAKCVRRKKAKIDYKITVHRNNDTFLKPKVSIILLDWECRERFSTLDWLSKQDVLREQYEIIWIELYNRIVEEALKKADVVITCGQKGMYHKHIGYNIGLLHAKGEIITICDSDAIYPPNFISSILDQFNLKSAANASSIVLMHHELRTSFFYPNNLINTEELLEKKWNWWPLNPNAGACMSVRKEDAIRFGGFDEHNSYRGYLCGPYDLGWRLVNAGIPEIWHDSTFIWHFAHPDPVGVNGLKPKMKMLMENTYPHVDLHAITAVEAFSTGKMLPLEENPNVFNIRMEKRKIGTPFEEKYASMTGLGGFSRWCVIRLRFSLIFELCWTLIKQNCYNLIRILILKLMGQRIYERLRKFKQSNTEHILLDSYKGYNLVKYRNHIYGIPQSLGPVDLNQKKYRKHPSILLAEIKPDLEKLIDKVVPELLDSYKGYNLVSYKNRIYGIHQSFGEVDFNTEEQLNQSSILSAETVRNVKMLIDMS